MSAGKEFQSNKLAQMLFPPKKSEVMERNTKANKNCFYNFLVELIDLEIARFYMLLTFLILYRTDRIVNTCNLIYTIVVNYTVI